MRRTILATGIGVALLAITADVLAQDAIFPDPIHQPQSTGSLPSRPLPARPDVPSVDEIDNGSTRGFGSSWSTLIALAVVIGLILVAGKSWRRFAPASSHSLPGDAVIVLGKKSLDSRHSLSLLKCGSRILVLGFSPHGMHTLTEISDAVEVDLLAGLCSAASSGNRNTTAFADLWKRTSEFTNSSSKPVHSDASQVERYADTHA